MAKKINKPEIYRITTGMGKVMLWGGHPLSFLTDKEKDNLDEIGYTGKLKGEKMSRERYLNSLGKGSFSVEMTKSDDGDFTEEFIIARSV